MRNMAVLHSPAFSYPLPVLVRVLFNLLIFKGKILYYNKYTKKHKKRDASFRTHLHYNHIIFKVLSIPTTYYQPIFSSPAALYQAMER